MHDFRPAVFNFDGLPFVVGGEDDGGDEARHFIGDGGEIDFYQRLSGGDVLAFFYQHFILWTQNYF